VVSSMSKNDDVKYEYVLHCDWDYLIPKAWRDTWKAIMENSLVFLHLTLKRIITKPSPSKKGALHLWIHVGSSRELSEDEINMLQWLIGLDDPTRVWINRMRIERGLKKFWNKIFTRHVWVRPLDEKCKRCKIRRVLNEMRKELKE